MLLLTPIFVPIITKLAPVGPAMFAVCTILDTPMEESTTESLPFIAMICFIILPLTFTPGLVLWLPKLLM